MVWVIGCNNYIGLEIIKQLKENKIPFVGTDKELDITDITALEDFEKNIEREAYLNYENSDRHIRWVINCSTIQPVRAEICEEIPEENLKKINLDGALNVARVTRKIGAKLIHFSNAFVFNGNSTVSYSEDMEKNPFGIYGKYVSLGEDAVQKEINQYYIIRTGELFGDVEEIKQLFLKFENSEEISVVTGKQNAPTSVLDLAAMILKLIQKTDSAKEIFGRKSAPSFGIYNFCNGGKGSNYEFMQELYKFGTKYKKITGKCNIKPVSKQEASAEFLVPENSALNTEKIVKTLKIKIPDWQNSLEKIIKTI